MTARDFLFKAYMDWVNNYLTPEKYAEHHGLTLEQAEVFINLARDVFESPHPES